MQAFTPFISQRLKSELTKLRRMYEEETEKAKQEFMYLHSSKVMQPWFWIKNIKAGHWIEWIDDQYIGLVIQLYNKVIIP